jgi:Protein of unknown function (DUF1648)
MSRKLLRLCAWLLWLALPITALRYWMVWDQLPVRIATHFNAAGQPNGWMTREQSLTFGLVLTAVLLAVFTAILYFMEKKNAGDTVSWSFLAFSCFLIGMIYYGNESILAFNLHGRPVEAAPFLLMTPLALIIFAAIYLGSKRGSPLPEQDWLAEEVHGSKLWASLFSVPLILQFGAMRAIPLPGVRIGLKLVSVIFVIVAAQAWSGFHYRFGMSGMEISTLGFRLRSIPRTHIREYSEQSWNPLGGYGIRGIGQKRAYVWGNRGVLIKTSEGEVFLGHSRPQQIIRDLDLMKQ